ncbi:predicted protein [Pyrenophora tritici-repentis Pt-1C-BFP]|uniref:Uncharacterized protein n=1 Tax=Pyrenophora tritici-repentis (strain Pt-1C-BFP) TaxID=426418 RepID=B2WGZ8_PYRTR|nr:uncharacterized protein PTRG_09257 [Pyrenophora tritici-repentis Pt-1C-BFP]EDU42308.1 predicted protein [Pyrenophora tritici-repentis Pt-1C-BFP]
MRFIHLFISTAKAFLSLLARAEPEYLEYVRPKLLPHRLSFDRGSNFSTQAAQSHDLDGQADASMSVSNPFLLPSYISSASTSPSPSTSAPSVLAEQRLGYLHPNVQDHKASIIKLGDNFLREDVVTFLRSFCRRWSQTDLGYRPGPNSFAGDDSIMQSMFRHYYHAEAFGRRSDIDRVKYRFSRILLYHDFEELCINIQNNLERYRPLSRGQDAATIATDKFIDGLALVIGAPASIVAILPIRLSKRLLLVAIPALSCECRRMFSELGDLLEPTAADLTSVTSCYTVLTAVV